MNVCHMPFPSAAPTWRWSASYDASEGGIHGISSDPLHPHLIEQGFLLAANLYAGVREFLDLASEYHGQMAASEHVVAALTRWLFGSCCRSLANCQTSASSRSGPSRTCLRYLIEPTGLVTVV
jgi:hypothetical protein